MQLSEETIQKADSTIEALALKLEQANKELAAKATQEKHLAAQDIVKNYIIGNMSLGLLPLPYFDLAAMAATQLSLIKSLSEHYNISYDEQMGKLFLTSLISGSAPVLTVIGLSSFIKIIPGIGSITGGVSLTLLAGAVAYATGQVFIRHFESGGDFANLESSQWNSFFKEQITIGKQYIKTKLKSMKDK
ncbi:MAG: DUF697 domain-containing protein [Thiofilum sp.]|uniref:YcjF family protein n=1 Tax=Thiofilum sp. TaxID=2212733 RepID=UPI0025E996D5|nr:DUF697 domain-containing protein [Thiofilum sp.]MBK8452758.1 DUF697 domain-containing protein [Thiofilum sp.]